ncbi:hypothetical protein BTVI_15402 [Pitangus sulphuratus]|nr:hypothetical protein BTVI_15402 [Pitangus sulphuratus]
MPVFKKSKKDPGNPRLVSLTSVLGKVVEQLILEIVSGTSIIRKSSRGVHMEKKMCLAHLINFCDEFYDWPVQLSGSAAETFPFVNIVQDQGTHEITYMDLPRSSLESEWIEIPRGCTR